MCSLINAHACMPVVYIYLVELQARVDDLSRPVVGLEVLAGEVVDDGLVAPLVGDEVDVVAEVAEGRERHGVLQAGHARRLRELVVELVVVHHHVHRRRRPVRLAACTCPLHCIALHSAVVCMYVCVEELQV
jgi:hypothetical protein